ncbi:DUF3094 family protein [Umboniibacter marinipuniceus]|uniref:DUF3094 family protein n=1 Tax=Umboniibacter marinipuniceus TaxID=569599 RepID=A0A3M0ABR2_9GAMM|nr:DUF3094 family protein [Umboniibacter marinipuniceus]RMA82340.1 DUF3094 family protein [Umboniibacter marinipuniceus]
MRDKEDLSPEDLARVEEYLNSTIHQTDRGEFKFWRLMGVLSVVLIAFGALAMYVAIETGVWNSGRWL